METTIEGLGFRVYSPPKVEYGVIWGSDYEKPQAMFYLLKGDYTSWAPGPSVRATQEGASCK